MLVYWKVIGKAQEKTWPVGLRGYTTYVHVSPPFPASVRIGCPQDEPVDVYHPNPFYTPEGYNQPVPSTETPAAFSLATVLSWHQHLNLSWDPTAQAGLRIVWLWAKLCCSLWTYRVNLSLSLVSCSTIRFGLIILTHSGLREWSQVAMVNTTNKAPVTHRAHSSGQVS